MQELALSSLGHLPGEKWAFDDSVANVFDDMLARSIPQYETMRSLVFDLAAPFVQPSSDIVDLGCSRGEALAPFLDRYGDQNSYTGVEVSQPMIAAARDRFERKSNVEILDLDLRSGYPDASASVTLSVLTLMFVPINYRQRIVQNVFDSTLPGGAFLLVEKLIGSSAATDSLFVDRYHRMKSDNGYSQEEIQRKALALEGVQVPVTAGWNEDLLRSAGFAHVECFWRWCNFAAWIAVKARAAQTFGLVAELVATS